MKYCITCKKTKAFTEFYWRPNGKPRGNKCKQCEIAKNSEWNRNNSEKMKENAQRWRDKHPQKSRRAVADNRARRLKRKASWADKEHIDFVYHACNVLNNYSSYEWQVDHIVPLQGQNVSGLHVGNNLQLLQKEENLRKHNKWT
jgi:5-methylcytosine-specific restriction endonuclease McrA